VVGLSGFGADGGGEGESEGLFINISPNGWAIDLLGVIWFF